MDAATQYEQAARRPITSQARPTPRSEGQRGTSHDLIGGVSSGVAAWTLRNVSVMWVELRGLEPLTPTLPVWCATSCAIAPRSCAHRSYTTANMRSKSQVRGVLLAHAIAHSKIAHGH